MKKMRSVFLIGCFILAGIAGFAQSPVTAYTGTGLPATQGWHELKFDSDMLWEQAAKDLTVSPSALSAVATSALKLKVTEEVNEELKKYSQLVWYKANTGFSSATGFTVEFRAKVTNATPGSFSIYGFDATKRGFRLELSNDLLAEHSDVLNNPRELSTASTTDGFHNYRVAVAPDGKVRVWRDDVLVGTLPVQTFKADNIFVDGGYENGKTAAEHGWTLTSETAQPGTIQISSDPAHVRSGSYGLYVDKGTFVNKFIPVKPGALYDASVWTKNIFFGDDGEEGHWRDFNGWYDPATDRGLYGVVKKESTTWEYAETLGKAGGGMFQRFISEIKTGDKNTNKAAFDDAYFSERINPSRIPVDAVNLFPNGDMEDAAYKYFPDGDPRNDTTIVNTCDGNECPAWHPFWGARVRMQYSKQGNGETGNYFSRSGKNSLRYYTCGQEPETFYGDPAWNENPNDPEGRGSNSPLNCKVELEPNKTYTFSFWYHTASWPDNMDLAVENGSVELWSQNINNSNSYPNWVNKVITFTTTATDHTLVLRTIRKGHCVVYFDDFFLFEGELLPEYDNTYLAFGKPTSTDGTEVEIEWIKYDITGAYAPGSSTPITSTYQKQTAPLMTTWGENLQPTDEILNQYPRPQLERENWVNLNGIWKFARKETKEGFGTYNATESYRQEILVPFPIESALSGIMDNDYANMNKTYVYKRTFTVDPAYSGKKIILHFDAVDWESYVFVNGTEVAHHTGGYDPFSIDITDQLTGSGEQELVVQVYDPTKGGNPRGKQDPLPSGIWYTPSSGIWQTVWYEAVDPTYITNLSLTPVDNSALKIRVDVENASGATAEVVILDGTTEVATKTVTIGQDVTIPVSNARLWSPDSPFLYGLSISIKKGATEVDKVSSYFGMRKIEKKMLRDKPYMFLNDEPIFHYGTLDQGFWPDGLHTAPTYEALLYDLEETKKLGMNMVRKHIKTEPARWYYYCDSIGLMVWQDMPTPAGLLEERVVGDGTDDAVKANFLAETEAIVNNLKNYPSIVMWVPYNEAWGQFAGSDDPAKGDPSHTINGVNLIRSLDDTRLINPASGWTSYEIGDIQDKHNYSEPALHVNKYNERVSVCGETGGYGFVVDGHIWSKSGNPYGSVKNEQEFAEALEKFNTQSYSLTSSGINGIVYTQITDVEEEVNGFLTYDRKVNKLALSDSVAGKVLKEGIKWMKSNVAIPILKTNAQGGDVWKYITGDEYFVNPGTGWNTDSNFDDSGWKEGRSGFGRLDNLAANTPWTDQSIFLRKIVSMPNLSGADRDDLKFTIFWDEDYEFYINGVLAATASSYSTSYQDLEISENAKNAIVWGGDNLFAIYVIQTTGGQFIDLGISSSKNKMPLDYEPIVEPVTWIEISTPEEFKAIKDNLSGFYKLTANLDLYAEDHQQIGTTSAPFIGYFDGNGHTIRCPELNIYSNGESNVGLFGYAVGAHFTNLRLTDASVEGRFDVGALLGKGLGVTVEKVVAVEPKIQGEDHVGALIGGLFQHSTANRIKDCYVENGDIISTARQAGGLVGVMSDTRIENSYFTGTVIVEDVNAGDKDGAGIVSRIENGMNSFRGVVSLASAVESGSANEFIAFGSAGVRLNEFINCYTRDDMELTDLFNPERDNQLSRAADEQKRPLSDFTTEDFYKSLGWDFENIWKMGEGSYPYPVFQNMAETGVPSVSDTNTENNLSAYLTNGDLIINVKQPASVWIYDAAGKLVKRLDVENSAQLSLPQGIYVINSACNGKVEAIKVII